MKALNIIIVLLIAMALLSACGTVDVKADPEKFLMNEPEYLGLDKNGDPQFKLSWSAVKNSDWYEVNIYSEVDGSASRERVTPNENSCVITLLNFAGGYETDTARYRMKVRPRYSGNDIWSSVWEINYVAGTYSIMPDAEDFEQSAVPIVTPQPSEKKEALPHSYPESLVRYEAEKSGLADIDFSDVAALKVNVNHCEYGEPTQTISDPDTVFAALDAISEMTVTGKHDSISSTGTYYAFSFYDTADNYIAGFAFQDGMLMEYDGRYSVTGLSALLEIEGIMLEQDWEDYWEAKSAGLEEYENQLALGDGATILDLGGYNAYLLAQNIDNAELLGLRVRGDEYRGLESFFTEDAHQICSMLDALLKASVTGETDDVEGQHWCIEIHYSLPGDLSAITAVLNFTGSALESELGELETSGLDGFFNSADSVLMADLRDNREKTVPEPIY